jgi:septal ring factor EnvC (AmiA/AmiB activator)
MRDAKQIAGLFLLVFLGWLCILVSTAVPDAEGPETEAETDRLAKIERELEEKRIGLQRLNQQEKQALVEFLEMEERLGLTEQLIGRLLSRESSVGRELKAKRRTLRETDSTLYSHRKNTARRLRDVYKRGRFGRNAAAVAAFSPLDLGSKPRFLSSLLVRDQEMLVAIEALKAELTQRKRNLDMVKPEISWMQGRKQREQMTRLEALAEKEKTLDRIESKKRLCLRAIGELEEEARGLREALGRPQNEDGRTVKVDDATEGSFEALKGKLPWPLEGTVIRAFGRQIEGRFRTATENPGIEIRAKSRSPVLAAAAGVVAYSSRLKRYGGLVLLEHVGGYYTLYARLSEVSVPSGDRVGRLEPIGWVGGDASATAGCLHFEIRKGRRALDPLEWLK